MKHILFYFLTILVSGSAFAISNSTPAEEDEYIPVVLIRVEAQDDDGSRTNGLCNATFISDRTLVTAAHCLTHAQLLRSKQIQIEIGKYRYVIGKDGIKRRVGYASFATINDEEARFFLQASLEDKLRRTGFKTVIQPNEDNAKIELSRSVDLVGLGFSPVRVASPAEMDVISRDPSRYPLTVVSVNPVAEIATNDVKRKAVLNSVSWNRGGWIESRSTSQVQPLDSGAPVFVRWNGELRVVAVVKGHAKSFFKEWDVFSALFNW